MAITLVSSISGPRDNPIQVSADPGDYFKVDSEQFRTLGPIAQVASVGGSTAYVSVPVERGYNGTGAGPHTAGATVTPLFVSMTSTAGATV